MRDDERGAAFHQVGETFLDGGLGFRIQAAGSLVQDQDARIGKNGTGDGDALALSAGELDAAFADDGVVLLLELFGKLIDAGDAAGGEDLLFGGGGTREADVFADGAVEQEGVLQHHAELRAEGIQAHGGKVGGIDQDASGGGLVEGRDQADDGGFSGPEGPTSAVAVPGSEVKLTSRSTVLPASYSKVTFSKAT